MYELSEIPKQTTFLTKLVESKNICSSVNWVGVNFQKVIAFSEVNNVLNGARNSKAEKWDYHWTETNEIELYIFVYWIKRKRWMPNQTT